LTEKYLQLYYKDMIMFNTWGLRALATLAICALTVELLRCAKWCKNRFAKTSHADGAEAKASDSDKATAATSEEKEITTSGLSVAAILPRAASDNGLNSPNMLDDALASFPNLDTASTDRNTSGLSPLNELGYHASQVLHQRKNAQPAVATANTL
jgi:hypothetical protein